jgi:hypothetical protein
MKEQVAISFARSPQNPDMVVYGKFKYGNKKFFLTYDKRKPKKVIYSGADFPFASELQYSKEENIEIQNENVIEILKTDEKGLFWCDLMEKKLDVLVEEERSQTEYTATDSEDMERSSTLKSGVSPVKKLDRSVDEDTKIKLRDPSVSISSPSHTRTRSQSESPLPVFRQKKKELLVSEEDERDIRNSIVPDSPRSGLDSAAGVLVNVKGNKFSSTKRITKKLAARPISLEQSTPQHLAKEKTIIYTREKLNELGLGKKDSKGKLKLDWIHAKNLKGEEVPQEIIYMASNVIYDGVCHFDNKKRDVAPSMKVEENDDILIVRHEYSQPNSFFNARVIMKWQRSEVEEGKQSQYSLLDVRISGEHTRLVENCLKAQFSLDNIYRSTHIPFDVISINQRAENALKAKQNEILTTLDELMKGSTNSTGIKNMRKMRSEGKEPDETLKYYKKTSEERIEEEQDNYSKSHVIGDGRSEWVDQIYHALAETNLESSASLDNLHAKIKIAKQAKEEENKILPLVSSQIACMARP